MAMHHILFNFYVEKVKQKIFFRCYSDIMRNEIFYRHLNLNSSYIKKLATRLSNDFSTARFLYIETAHLAMKNQKNLKEEIFHDWLCATMERINQKILRNEYPKRAV